MKGLLVDVLRGKGDCTNGGVTSKHSSVIIVGPGIPEIFEVTPEHPALRIVKRWEGTPQEYIHAEPVEQPSNQTHTKSAGGNFIYSCDSRFRELVCAYPVSVHDRFDTWEDNERLST